MGAAPASLCFVEAGSGLEVLGPSVGSVWTQLQLHFCPKALAKPAPPGHSPQLPGTASSPGEPVGSPGWRGEQGGTSGMCCSVIPDANPTHAAGGTAERCSRERCSRGRARPRARREHPMALPALGGTWKSWNLGKAGALGCAEHRFELSSTQRVAQGRNTPSCRGCKRQTSAHAISLSSKLSLRFLPCSDDPSPYPHEISILHSVFIFNIDVPLPLSFLGSFSNIFGFLY